MSEHYINLMPTSYRHQLGRARVRRRFFVYDGLALLVIAVMALSGQARISESTRLLASLQPQIDDLEMVQQKVMTLDQQSQVLVQDLAKYERLTLPIPMSAVVATVTEVTPPRIMVKNISMWIESRETSKTAGNTLTARQRRSKSGAPDPYQARRVLVVDISGYAMSDTDMATFLEHLEAHPIFGKTQMEYSRDGEFEGLPVRDFRIKVEVNLNVRYVQPTTEQVSAEEAGHE